MIQCVKEIPLTRGYVALVDDEDFDWLSKIKWHALPNRHNIYAGRARWTGKHLTTERMHRRIMNAADSQCVDHINGNGLDNRRCNLRLCTQLGNSKNARRYKNNSSGFKGVGYRKLSHAWVARIMVSRKSIFLGEFRNRLLAAIAYDNAARIHHGEFARLNFPTWDGTFK